VERPCSVIVLAAGRGTRMRSSTPKVLFDVCGAPSLEHVLRAATGDDGLRASRVVVVTAKDAAATAALAQRCGALVAIQDPPLGTGHAFRVGLDALAAAGPLVGDVVVLYGDGPLYRAATLANLLATHVATGAAQTLLTAVVSRPDGLGRIVRGGAGEVAAIVEELEADAATREIHEINTGIFAIRAAEAQSCATRLRNDNRKGEYYLTDFVAMLRDQGAAVGSCATTDAGEALMFNSIAELATVRAEMRRRILESLMEAGVDVVDPASTFVDVDVAIGAGTRLLPFTVVGRGVTIGRDCVIGPFAHLRVHATLEDEAEIGNFVEVKNSRVGKGSKAKHLTYLGDAEIGARVNVGCGTITANYDGRKKHVTRIGDGAFIGSGTVLVAPAEVGAFAMTGAGAIVRPGHAIGAGEVWVGVPARRLDDASARRRSELEASGRLAAPTPRQERNDER
jgi:bifunctional UDP-N-acetylglucosamine pyrophosphorylase/glucosamine-1-phosphate N-acetyltransferase